MKTERKSTEEPKSTKRETAKTNLLPKNQKTQTSKEKTLTLKETSRKIKAAESLAQSLLKEAKNKEKQGSRPVPKRKTNAQSVERAKMIKLHEPVSPPSYQLLKTPQGTRRVPTSENESIFSGFGKLFYTTK